MKIAYVITRADAVGGASIHVRDLAQNLRQQGHAVLVVLGGEGQVTAQLRDAGIPYCSLRHLGRAIHPWKDYLAYGEIKESLAAWKPDIVSTHTAKAGFLGRLACKRLGIPVTYTPHGWSIGQRISPLAGKIFSGVERMAATWSAAIVCVCEDEKSLALRKGIAEPGKLRVIHNGMKDIAPDLQAISSAEPVRVCCVARFEPPKDHATLFHSLRSIVDLDWKLDLIGDGPQLEEMMRLATHLGIRERITFHGYQPDPSRILSCGQVFVLSSRSEAFPRSILEALRAGLPVVATNVGGVNEAVKHGSNGLLVPPGRPDALSGALRAVIADRELRERMGTKARQDFEDRFRLEQMVEKTTTLYHEVLWRNDSENYDVLGNRIRPQVQNPNEGGNAMTTNTEMIAREPRRTERPRTEMVRTEMLRGGSMPSTAEFESAGSLVERLPHEIAHRNLMDGSALGVKRAFDIAFASLLLLAASPLCVLIALAIMLETGGNPLFRQSRIGMGGRHFSCWKFRTMVADSEEVLQSYLEKFPELAEEWHATHKLKDDPRVTRVGRILRRRSLDELPQLWNVLNGDMSMVGPRPIVDDEVPKYGTAMALYTRVRPGLTGLWQVSGRSDLSYRKRIALDCEYIRDWSMARDLKIILKTVWIVLRPSGAY